MAIILDDNEDRELGTTVSSRIRLIDDETGEATSADVLNNEHQVTLEIVNSDTGETVRAEETMENLVDSDGDTYYLGDWQSSETDDPGQYNFVHRATVNDDDYKLTKVVDMNKVKEDC